VLSAYGAQDDTCDEGRIRLEARTPHRPDISACRLARVVEIAVDWRAQGPPISPWLWHCLILPACVRTVEDPEDAD
jgi:hypothetical protein